MCKYSRTNALASIWTCSNNRLFVENLAICVYAECERLERAFKQIKSSLPATNVGCSFESVTYLTYEHVLGEVLEAKEHFGNFATEEEAIFPHQIRSMNIANKPPEPFQELSLNKYLRTAQSTQLAHDYVKSD